MSTTTTLVDYTDTQMLDEAMDGDFSMQNSPADWLAVEATMSDDNPTSAATDYSEAIEVDMEPHDEHDGEITEYEMADDALGEVDYDGDAQFLDAEVEVEQQVPTIQLNSGEITAVEQHPPTPPAHFALPTMPLADVSVVMGEPFRSQDVVAMSPLPEEDFSAELQHVNAEVPPLSVHEVVAATPVTDYIPALPEEHTAEPAVESAPAESFVYAGEPPADGEAHLPTEHAEADLSHEPAENEATPVFGEAPPSSLEGRSEEVPEVPHDEHEEATDTALEHHAEVYPSENAEHHDAVPDAPEVPAEVPVEEAREESDPHEISEGVYIDPPPAVLLSITSTTAGEFCLFNQPLPKSRSQSPGESSTVDSSLTLVLHQQPTLYYEPLSQVFAALRQEEVVYSSPELVDNELILEAYDLNLLVGEDNAYVSQVTIHDLNEIHDRLGLTGPLRLRLTAGSRFITRYHALREQIAQIALTADIPEAVAEPVPVHEDGNEEHYTEEQAAPHVAESEGDQGDGAHTEDIQEAPTTNFEHSQVEDHPTQHQEGDTANDQVPHSGEEEGVSGEAEQNQEGDEYTNPEDADDRAEEHETDPAAAVPELDADEVHHTADVEEGGDYTAPEEFQDDEGSGETLPEELGDDVVDETDSSEEDESRDAESDATAHLGHELAAAGPNDDNNDEYDQAEHDAEPSVVQADDAQLLQEEEADTVNASPHSHVTSTELHETEELYDYDDAEGEYYNQESYEHEEWDELEDPEAADTEHGAIDDTASSKHSSETLSTLSKRSREEDDDEEDEVVESAPIGTPHLKRVRTE